MKSLSGEVKQQKKDEKSIKKIADKVLGNPKEQRDYWPEGK